MMNQKVYVIQHALGPVKIGIAEEPQKRLSELQISCPYELKIKNTRESTDAERVEKALHEYFNRYHLRGEWFDIPKEFRDFTIPERVDDECRIVDEVVLPDERDMNKEWADLFEKAVLAMKNTRHETQEIRDLRRIWREVGGLPDPSRNGSDPTVRDPDLRELTEDTSVGMTRCSRCGHHYDQTEPECPVCSNDSFERMNDVW